MSTTTLLKRLRGIFFPGFGEVTRFPPKFERVLTNLEIALAFKCGNMTVRQIVDTCEPPYVDIFQDYPEYVPEGSREDYPLCRLYLAHERKSPMGQSFRERYSEVLEAALKEYAELLKVSSYSINGEKKYIAA